jgi:hypothetical protein
VGVEAGRFQKLDSGTGSTVADFVGIKKAWDSPYTDLLLLETRSRGYTIKGPKDWRIPSLSFALLDAAFGPDRVCVSEAGGAVRCVDCASGSEIWRYLPPRDTHVLRLYYRRPDRHFYGVQWEYSRGT